jgi:hypothetical protein
LSQNEPDIVYVKCELEGKPAKIIKELKKRGMVKSVREAVVQGILTYWDQVMTRDLREAQAQTSTRIAAETAQ